MTCAARPNRLVEEGLWPYRWPILKPMLT
jgi:hypothetical protein